MKRTVTDSAAEFRKHLDAGARFVLVVGTDIRIFDEIIGNFPEAAEASGSEVIRLNGADCEPSVLHGELSTIPMFSTSRLVILRHADPLIRKISENETLMAAFERDLPAIPDETHLIFHFDEERFPARFQFLANQSLIFEPRKLKDRDLAAWLEERITALEFSTERGVAGLIAERSGYDARVALASLDRLLLYKFESRIITIRDADELLTTSESDYLFRLNDQIAARKADAALELLQKHSFEDGVQLSAAWAKLFSDAARYHALRRAGLDAGEAHKRLKLNTSSDFAFRKNEERLQSILRNYGDKGLSGMLRRTLELDIAMKTASGLQEQQSLADVYLAALTVG